MPWRAMLRQNQTVDTTIAVTVTLADTTDRIQTNVSTDCEKSSQMVNAALVRRETPRRSRARPVASTVSRGAMEVLTEEV